MDEHLPAAIVLVKLSLVVFHPQVKVVEQPSHLDERVVCVDYQLIQLPCCISFWFVTEMVGVADSHVGIDLAPFASLVAFDVSSEPALQQHRTSKVIIDVQSNYHRSINNK